MLSKALLGSIRTIAVISFLSIALKIYMTSNKQTQDFSRVVFVILALVAGRLPS